MPATGARAVLPQTPGSLARWTDYVRRCAAIKGVTQCCVFDVDGQRSLAATASQRIAERLAAKGAMLHAALVDTANALGLAPGEPDAVVTLAQHLLMIRPMPGHPRVALHLVIERAHGNITLTRQQLQLIDQALLVGTH
jgi:hypothetical protein